MSNLLTSRALAGALALAAMGAAQAANVGISVLSATGGITNSAFAADGYAPPNGTHWQTDSAFWDGNAQSIVFKFDQAYQLSSALVTLDWNDVYKFEVSNDNANYTMLFTVSGLWAQQNSSVGAGQVTMPVSFATTASAYQYLRVSAVYGDGFNSVGEVALHGTAAAVPEPASWALMAAGAGLLGMRLRRRRG